MLKERDRKFTLFLKNWKTRCIQLFVDSIQFIFCYTKSVDYSILITTIVDPFEQAKKSFCITPPFGFPTHLNTVVPALEKLLCRPCNSIVWAWCQMLTSNSKEEKKEPQLANQSILCCLLLVLSLVCVNYENLACKSKYSSFLSQVITGPFEKQNSEVMMSQNSIFEMIAHIALSWIFRTLCLFAKNRIFLQIYFYNDMTTCSVDSILSSPSLFDLGKKLMTQVKFRRILFVCSHQSITALIKSITTNKHRHANFWHFFVLLFFLAILTNPIS